MELRQLQREMREWSERNFGEQPSYQPLLGVVEELGELAHAQLKEEQGIRTNENHIEDAQDAVGDLLIFLMNYCSSRGWDVQEILERTWDSVKQRDWKKNPENGVS